MGYMGAGIGIAMVIGICLGLYLLYLVRSAIKRAVRRFSDEAEEVRDITLEAPALERLGRTERLLCPRERQRAIDLMYFEGQLPNYVPDGLRDPSIISMIILTEQERRSKDLTIFRQAADRHSYAHA